MGSGSGSCNMPLNDVDGTPTIEGASSDPNVAANVSSAVGGSTSSRGKRKTVHPRSDVWQHFTKIEGENKCKCNYCDLIYTCDSVSCGTSTLRTHLSLRCKKYPYSRANATDNSQAQIAIQTSMVNHGVDGDSRTTLTSWKFDQLQIRKALAHMIITDELPFRFVEGQGFKYFCNIAQPKFYIPSRITMARDCYEIYVEEMLKLKTYMKCNCRRVCLTTDTWTSLQRINYMCLTAHFIDNKWKLNKKILNFCPISSHKGEAIGKAIEKCLNTWGIENVMTVTVDNASSNDVAIAYLKRRINNWHGVVLNGDFLHIRCLAHIMNLIVTDGLKLANNSVLRVRNAVRYIRQSPSRLQKFKICVEEEKIPSKSLLCLDVPTRWNSTYLMLHTAQKFEKAFERYEEQDPFFTSDLNDGDGLGKPQEEDWAIARNLTKILETFYNTTLKISGALYVTSNTYFHEISNIELLLKEWCENDNPAFGDMAFKMKLKCDKYWGNPEKLNVMMFFAVILDPRYKLGYIEFSITQMFDVEKATILNKKVKTLLFALYDECKNMYGTSSAQQRNVVQVSTPIPSTSTLSDMQPSQRSKPLLHDKYKQHKAEKEIGDVKSELVKYLEEDTEEDIEAFDILCWWKANSARFPILSSMARDVLAIPISTVASESAFSTGGRVLDAFRSSLSPKIVEALICTQDWFRASKERMNIEEKLEEIDQLDEELSSVTLAPNIIDIA